MKNNVRLFLYQVKSNSVKKQLIQYVKELLQNNKNYFQMHCTISMVVDSLSENFSYRTEYMERNKFVITSTM